MITTQALEDAGTIIERANCIPGLFPVKADLLFNPFSLLISQAGKSAVTSTGGTYDVTALRHQALR